MYLDMVLPKVVDGTWKGAADVEAMEKIEKDVNAVFTSFGPKGDPETALKGLAEFEEKYPLLKDIPYFRANRISMTIRTGKLEEARKMAEDYLAKGTKQEDPILLRTVASTTMTAKENKELMAVAVKAADTFVKVAGSDDLSALLLAAEVNITAGDKAKGTDYAKQAVAAAEKEIKTNGDKNYNSLLNAAEANFLASDKAKAQEYAKKAIALTEAPNFNPNLKRFIEGRAKKYLEENK
jgi:hypothetical protein